MMDKKVREGFKWATDTERPAAKLKPILDSGG
jgi:hypothetical protein